jgi:hypothetical protein
VYDYGFRIYNPRIAKFLSVDPITEDYPWLTSYQFASNRPIDGIDRDGLEFEPYWATTAPSNIRAYETQLRKKDPAHAEQIIRQHNMNAGLLVGGALTLGYGLAARPLLYRIMFVAYASPETVIGVTGLAASAIDPNPNSDYPGNFDDILRGGKLLLGKAYRLKEYAPKIDDAYHMFKEGFGLGIPKVLTPANQIIQAMYQTLKEGKKIAFDIKEVSLDAAKKGFKNFDEASDYEKITEWELSKILRDKDLYENTIFHQNGKEVKAKDIGLNFIEE